MTWLKYGGLSKLLAALCFLCLVSLVPSYSDDPADMTTEAIIAELISITERQTARLDELENSLTERKAELSQREADLNESRRLLQQHEETISELTNYSKSLESDIQKLTRWRAGLLTVSITATIIGVIGWIL